MATTAPPTTDIVPAAANGAVKKTRRKSSPNQWLVHARLHQIYRDCGFNLSAAAKVATGDLILKIIERLLRACRAASTGDEFHLRHVELALNLVGLPATFQGEVEAIYKQLAAATEARVRARQEWWDGLSEAARKEDPDTGKKPRFRAEPAPDCPTRVYALVTWKHLRRWLRTLSTKDRVNTTPKLLVQAVVYKLAEELVFSVCKEPVLCRAKKIRRLKDGRAEEVKPVVKPVHLVRAIAKSRLLSAQLDPFTIYAGGVPDAPARFMPPRHADIIEAERTRKRKRVEAEGRKPEVIAARAAMAEAAEQRRVRTNEAVKRRAARAREKAAKAAEKAKRVYEKAIRAAKRAADAETKTITLRKGKGKGTKKTRKPKKVKAVAFLLSEGVGSDGGVEPDGGVESDDAGEDTGAAAVVATANGGMDEDDSDADDSDEDDSDDEGDDASEEDGVDGGDDSDEDEDDADDDDEVADGE